MKEKVCVLNYIKTFKAVHKNNPRTYSTQQNKKVVLTTAAYLKASIPVRSQGQWQWLLFVYVPFPKRVSGIKQKKWTPPLNSAKSN